MIFHLIKTKKEFLILLFIFLLALFLRFYKLGEIPVYFHQDEVMNGYVGRFVLSNGQDPYGNKWPLLYFNRFGDYPPILPMYLSGVSTFIFGVNEFAVRFPSAFFGALLVLPLFFLGKLIFQDNKTALFASFILAILPWHIVLSRATAEGILGLTFSISAIFLLLKGIRDTRKNLILYALVLFFITYFLYPSFRVLTPLILLPAPFLIEKNIKNLRQVLIFSIIFFFFLTLWISSTSWGKGRFLQTSIFNNSSVVNEIKASNTALSNDEGRNNVLVARIFHNKIIGYFNVLGNQYLSYFSTPFLFVKGGLPTRYNVPDQGLFYNLIFFLILAAFLPFGKRINNNLFVYLLWLLLIAPIPAALTVDDVPNVHRAVFMIVPVVFLAAFGFSKLEEFTHNFKYKSISLVLVVATVLLALEFIYFFHQYSAHEASVKSVLRNGGDKELISYIKENNFSNVIMPVYDTLPFYYLFFTNNFNASYAGKFKQDITVGQAENVQFVTSWCPITLMDMKNLPAKTLVAFDGRCENFGGLREIKTITRRDGTVAFRLFTTQK